MKICRFNEDRLGLVIADQVADVTAALEGIVAPGWPQPPGDFLIRAWESVAARLDTILPAAARYREMKRARKAQKNKG